MKKSNVKDCNKKAIQKQKGITLIALIITIIVMIILVMVSVSVALQGGIFTKAQNAAKKTQVEADREQLLDAVVAAYDGITGKVDFDYLDGHRPDGFTGGSGTYTSKKQNTFLVDEYGAITYLGEDGNTLALLQKYFIGRYLYNLTRPGMDLADMDAPDGSGSGSGSEGSGSEGSGSEGSDYEGSDYEGSDYEGSDYEGSGSGSHGEGFADDSSLGIKGSDITFISYKDRIESNTNDTEDYAVRYLFVEYAGQIYKVKFKSSNKTIEYYDDILIGESVQLSNEAETEGSYPTSIIGLGGKNWTILRWFDDNTVEAVYDEALGSLRLGVSADAEGNEKITTAIESYNNAIELITNECDKEVKKLFGNNLPSQIKRIRSVGAIEDPNKLFYNSKASDKFPEKIEWIDYSQLDWFDSHIVLDGIKGTDGLQIKSRDELHYRDLNLMQDKNIAAICSEYWMASRYVNAYSNCVYFNVRYVRSDGDENYCDLWNAYSDGYAGSRTDKYAVRPVIKITLDNSITTK